VPRDHYIGIDIGGTKLLAGLVREDGAVVGRVKSKVPVGARAAVLFREVRRLCAALLEGVPRSRGRLQAAGVGVPGMVDGRGRIVASPNIDLAGFPLRDRLRRELGRPVAIGNDVNLAVLGEQWLGAARGLRDVVGLFPGTGVGGGVLVAGRLVTGAHGAAGELGHLLVDRDGPECGCGNRGCLEALASRRALERRIRKAVDAGERSLVRKLSGGDLRVIRSGVLRKALKRGDPLVRRVLRKAGERLGEACVSLRHVFDPELFVFGGGLVEACGFYLLPIVRRSLDADPFFRKLGRCRVAAAGLGDDAVLLGAVAAAMGLPSSKRSVAPFAKRTAAKALPKE